MGRALLALLQKEFLQIRRDPVILRMLFVMPLIQLVVLANAATFEVKRSRLWVVDQDRTSVSADLVARFTATGRFTVAGRSAATAPGVAAMDRGESDAILVLPRDFARDLATPGVAGDARVQLILNAENGSQAGVTQGYAAAIVAGHAAERGGAGPRRGHAALELRTRGRFNPTLEYRHFMVPGVLVQLIVLVGTLMTALNIVREKEAGTLDSLNVTPLRPAVFIAAKLIPLWLIGLVEFAGGLVIATQLFGVPLEGSATLLMASAGIFLLGALGVGLWISTVSDTQQQAVFVTFSLLMVYILMSGLFTPVRGMPDWVRALAQLNPMMHFIALVRAVMLRGAGLADVAGRLGALALLGTAILALAVGRYRKREA